VFRLDGGDTLLNRSRRLGQRSAKANGFWTCPQIKGDQLPGPPQAMNLPTDLTVSRVQEILVPDTLSVWALPSFIALARPSGFSSIRHRLHFQALMALPLLCATMSWSPRLFHAPARRGGVAKMIGSGGPRASCCSLWSRSPRKSASPAPCPWRLRPGRRGFRLMLASPVAAHGRRLTMID